MYRCLIYLYGIKLICATLVSALEFGLSSFLLFRWRSVPWCTLHWRTTIAWSMEERPSLSCARSSRLWRTPGCCSLTCEPLWTPGPTKQTTLNKQWLYSPDEHYRNCSWCILLYRLTRGKKGFFGGNSWVVWLTIVRLGVVEGLGLLWRNVRVWGFCGAGL